MKTISILILNLIFCNLFPQETIEKIIKTEVNEVTVFLEGAQIISKKKVDLLQGITAGSWTRLQ